MVVKGEIEEDSSRNLLQRFGGRISSPDVAGGGVTCEVELSLGLSLNGCFGVEPKERRLIRSSSISSFSIFPIEHNVPLTRTCSLPAEAEEERRKRKDMESFKRMEAKRKRSEKKAAKDWKDENSFNLHNNNNKGDQVIGGKMNGVAVNGEVGRWVMGKGVNGGGGLASQGSIGSQGSGSSSVSDFESKQIQGVDVSGVGNSSGMGNCAEVRNPSTTIPLASNHTNQKASTTANITTILSASNHSNQKASTTANITREGDEPLKKKSCRTNGVKESERNMMEEMPCVSTKGDGPNGRRIEGFLYKYRKGEEVRIVCVCHGQFLTPAEFVKHAGGGDVAHPLRHIVVSPTPASL